MKNLSSPIEMKRRRSISVSGTPEDDIDHIKRRNSVCAPTGSSAHDIFDEGVRSIYDEMRTTGIPYVCCDKISKVRLTPNDGLKSLKINNNIFEGECIVALVSSLHCFLPSYF